MTGAPSASAHGDADHSAGGHAGRPVSSSTLKELAAVRAATARYHDVAAALADGYAPAPVCAELPGVGGMGYHFVNEAHQQDGIFDVTRPEILLYAPGPDGLRLAGVEYLAVDADQDLTTDDDRPELFGVPFDGPMPGHEPGMPVHYDLHVWVWRHNPAGMFAVWNPGLSCAQG
ncbi:hypothetical protein [Micromonospora echinofusca]|uniref:Uncharacterized protein n=1 Tax=Micromonospora echinofusca TaxID=47858 RepID=A0ABS3W132_MICEH|nr:hypothetical protein [Micromonospora echinofusca]MBO4210431.1 hypothetical protein [Micromonospora echinofusca]